MIDFVSLPVSVFYVECLHCGGYSFELYGPKLCYVKLWIIHGVFHSAVVFS